MTTYIDMIYEGITLNGKTYNLVTEEEIRQFNSYSFALVEAVAEDADKKASARRALDQLLGGADDAPRKPKTLDDLFGG